MLILAGPSAVGKTTVMERLLTHDDIFSYVHSVTTRPIRFEGDDEYIHLTMEEFVALRERGGLLESTVYGDCAYGTPRSEIERITAEGKTPLLILDINGVRTLKGQELPVLSVYIYDSLNVMEERLYERELKDNPSVEALLRFAKRKDANLKDFSEMGEHAPYFDLLVHNETLDETVKEIISLVRGDRSPMDDAERKEKLAFFEREVREKLACNAGR